MNTSLQLKMTIYASLLAALMAVSSYFPLPIGPVPIVLQNMFVLLSGVLLGSKWGLASVGVYVLAGACGLPVFAGGLGGISRIAGPTGGYLLGYLPAVYIVGLITERLKESIVLDVIAMLCGCIIIYTCGITWLKVLTGMTWSKTLMVGMYPFVVGDTLKIAAAAAIAKGLRPVIIKSGSSPNHLKPDHPQ
jgi:biotin transport system substrate-specific component